MFFNLISLISVIVLILVPSSSANYFDDRNQILQEEASKYLGSSIVLTPKEQLVNEKLMQAKYNEFYASFNGTEQFLPSIHFFRSRNEILNSEVFKIIKQIPKGASLHSHIFAMASFEVVYNLTFHADLYVCNNATKLALQFFFNGTDQNCEWVQIDLAREQVPGFDRKLEEALTVIVENPELVYANSSVTWIKFEEMFDNLGKILTYKPNFETYFYQALEEFYQDNVMYVEFRSYSPGVFDDTGKVYSTEEIVGIYVEVLNQFKLDHPGEFFNVRNIFSPYRKVDSITFDDYLQTVLSLQSIYPDFVAGFDLVGQEDLGEPLITFAEQLLQVTDQINFFFHSGETNWNGSPTDLNLIDAILLNTTRIGHGYAVAKHPRVLELLKEKNVAVELNPIANQVLGLVRDFREHTGAHLFADGYPVVVSCDDPGAWGAKGLSYDWYIAFMGMTSLENGDLRVLKQLALNSLEFSVMEVEEKAEALRVWEIKWDQFLDEILLG